MNAFPTEFADVIRLIGSVFSRIDDAREDDGKVSTSEGLGISLALTPDILRAVKGARDIPRELRALDQASLDQLRDEFLTQLDWNPSDNSRDKFAIAYEVATALILGYVKWQNTVKPLRPEIVP